MHARGGRVELLLACSFDTGKDPFPIAFFTQGVELLEQAMAHGVLAARASSGAHLGRTRREAPRNVGREPIDADRVALR